MMDKIPRQAKCHRPHMESTSQYYEIRTAHSLPPVCLGLQVSNGKMALTTNCRQAYELRTSFIPVNLNQPCRRVGKARVSARCPGSRVCRPMSLGVISLPSLLCCARVQSLASHIAGCSLKHHFSHCLSRFMHTLDDLTRHRIWVDH